jgi:hypothetical protein
MAESFLAAPFLIPFMRKVEEKESKMVQLEIFLTLLIM